MTYKKLVNELLEKHDYLQFALSKVTSDYIFSDKRMNELGAKHYNENDLILDWYNYRMEYREWVKDDDGFPYPTRKIMYKKLYEIMIEHVNLKQAELWDCMIKNRLVILNGVN